MSVPRGLMNVLPLVWGRRLDAKILEIALKQLGLITRKQLLALGLSSSAIHHRVATGRLVVVQAGIYALPGLPPTWDQRLLAAQLAVGDGAISHRSAGQFYRLDGVVADRPDVLLFHPFRQSLRDVTVHRSRTLQTGALDDVLRRRLSTLDRIVARVDEMPASGVPGLGVLRGLLDDRTGRAIE